MNIKDILTKLYESGMTDKAIGIEIGASQPTVTRLRNGVHKKTSYDLGTAINNLAKKRLPDQINRN